MISWNYFLSWFPGWFRLTNRMDYVERGLELRLMKWAPALLAVAVAICLWSWGGGRVDV